jgi:hypothetical protein
MYVPFASNINVKLTLLRYTDTIDGITDISKHRYASIPLTICIDSSYAATSVKYARDENDFVSL